MDAQKNPASILLEFLREFKRIGASGALSVRKCIADILKSKESSVEVYSALLNLHKLIDQAQFDIASIPNIKREIYVEALSRVRGILCPDGLDITSVEHFKRHELDDAIDKLQMMEDILERAYDHATDAEYSRTLSEITSEIDSLYEDLQSSKINRTLRNILLDLVESMRRCLHEHGVRGTSGRRSSPQTPPSRVARESASELRLAAIHAEPPCFGQGLSRARATRLPDGQEISCTDCF
jgi:hypothetical protein